MLHVGEILGLIGPNGAGKTTLVNAMTGVQSTVQGSVVLDGKDASRWSPERIAQGGVARTFQSVRIFADLTVTENLEAGAVGAGASRWAAAQTASELLEWMELGELGDTLARNLSGGDERRVGILRALACKPRYLLLDEPAAGLNETESEVLGREILELRSRFNCGVLLIEHDVRLIMSICDRLQVLDSGRTLKVGTPEEVQASAEVTAAYLGDTIAGSGR